MVSQLWLMMMGLILFALVFLWLGQVFLFERTYSRTILEDTWKRLEPVMEKLQNDEFNEDDHMLPLMSRVMDSRLMLVDESGAPKAFYASGYEIPIPEDEPEYAFWSDICSGEAADAIASRTSYQETRRLHRRLSAVLLGIPIRYDGEDSYLLLYHELDLDTLLRMNRRQLIGFCLILTIAASILAALCSRGFTRPLYAIRDAIDRLAGNDFSADLHFKRRDEIGRLADSVDTLGENLKRIDVLRKELIANVSHELKSPLALISGYAEMVRDIDWRDDGLREEDLNLIIEEAGRMSEMVNDILDYSQLQSGYLRLKPELYDICELAASETAHCAAGAAAYHIRLNFVSEPESVTIRADALKLSQVLRNLLYNAINHTPENGTITVQIARAGGENPTVRRTNSKTLGAAKAESAATKDRSTAARDMSAAADAGSAVRYRVSVINPGEPIPEEDRAVIWERYQRSQHQNGRHMGTGIGLSIVRTILEAHHMPYGVDCADGETSFWFECEEAKGGGS